MGCTLRVARHAEGPRVANNPRSSSAHRAPRAIVTGSVSSHDAKMSAVIAHRTTESRRVAPTPRIADVIAWVVLTGIPSSEAIWITVAPATSAAKPWTGSRVVIRQCAGSARASS
jgi:hypothetical protein